MSRDVKSIISQMTLKEKAGMCSGADLWHLKGWNTCKYHL